VEDFRRRERIVKKGLLVIKLASASSVVLAVLSLLALASSGMIYGQPQSRFAKLDAIRVHYNDYGKGREALVFIHGWTCNAEFWKANIPAFTNQTRVIAVDLPGHGQSDKPETIAYSMDLFARAVDAVMRDAGVERATLVGHSMGTPVIRQFYRLFPKKTRALVIVDGGLKPLGTAESFKPFLDGFRGPEYKKQAEQSVAFLTKELKDEPLRKWIQSQMTAAPQHVMVSAMEGMLDPAIWKTQDKIAVPTLAVMAAGQSWNAEYEKYVRDLVPGIEYQTWPGVSHFLMMEEPQKFNETLLLFLKKNKLVK
jgi:pimeloyl-ACP methyl ester carboxylesterase